MSRPALHHLRDPLGVHAPVLGVCVVHVCACVCVYPSCGQLWRVSVCVWRVLVCSQLCAWERRWTFGAGQAFVRVLEDPSSAGVDGEGTLWPRFVCQ